MRILPYQYSKSIFSMNRTELLRLHHDLTSFSPEGATASDIDRIRITLTAFPSLRFKLNSSNLDLSSTISKALDILASKVNAPVPEVSPSVTPSIPSPTVTTTVSDASPSAPSVAPSTDTSSLTPLIPLLPPLLRQEALSVQELYFLPRAQLHAQLRDLVQKSIDTYAHHVSHSTLTPSLETQLLGSDTQRQFLAFEISKYNQRIRNFFKRINWHRDQLEGRNPDPSILASLDKQAHRVGCTTTTVLDGSPSSPPKPLGSYTRTEIEHGIATTSSSAPYEEIKAARILRNKKLLNRRDRQKTQAHLATVTQAATELHEWGIPLEKGQAATCEHYGFLVPQDWLRQSKTPEQRAADHNEASKRYNQKKNALQRQIKAAQKAEEEARLDAFFPPEEDLEAPSPDLSPKGEA